jgi:3-oxoadipate enol-lactonase
MRVTEVSGGVVHYADDGPRTGHAIAFINSLGTDFRIWDDVAPALQSDFRVIRYDKRGHGLSAAPSGAMAIADYATDLAGLLDHLGVKAATIVGLSIGGMIAQELYRLRGDLVASLILSDTGHRIGNNAIWDGRIGAVEAGGIEAVGDGVMERWFTADYRREKPAMVKIWRAMLTRTPKQGYIAGCRAVRDADLTEGAGRIAAPTTILVGDQDVSTSPALAEELCGLIKGARLETIAGAGHLPCIEKPWVVRSLIEAHLKGLLS